MARKSTCTRHTKVGPLLEVVTSKKCTLLWREANFQVKMYKAPQCRTAFGSWHVEKVHAVVARSTFGSQNVQSTPCPHHFSKKNTKTIAAKALRTSDHLFPCQNACFICWYWCSTRLSTILQVMEKGGVSIGMFQTSSWSFDVRRTECVGQTIFSVMAPASKKNTETIAKKTLRTSDHLFPCQNACFMSWCSKCVSTILTVMEKGGVGTGMFQTIYLSFDVRRTECVAQTIFSVMAPVSKENTRTIVGKTLRTSDHLVPCQNACFICWYWCSKCLSTILQVMEKGGVGTGMFQTIYLSFDVRRIERVGQTIFSVMAPVSKKKTETIARKTLRTSDHLFPCQNACFICWYWCSKCLSTILTVVEKGGVSIGMFQTSYLSFDVRRTECVGQTIFSVMAPVSKENTRTIVGKTLRTSDHLVPCQNACFICWYWCSKRLSTILQVMEKGRVSRGMFQTSYWSFDVRRTECVGQTIFSVMAPTSKKNTKTIAGKTLRTPDHLFPVKMHVLSADIDVPSVCPLYYK